jgi:hypothetical protein
MKDVPRNACALALVACCACSSASTPPPPVCQGTPAGQSSSATCVLEVDGTVTNLDGLPFAAAPVSVCSEVCFFGKSDSAGNFTVKVGMRVDLGTFAAHVDGRPDGTDLFVPLSSASAGSVRLDTLVVPDLGSAGPSLPPDGAPGSSIASGPVTLVVADGTQFTLTIGDISLGDKGRVFRVADVPMDRAPLAARQAGLVALVAMSPFGTTASKPLGVALTNTAGLAAGAAVELLALDDNVGSSPPTAGTFRVVATGHVSVDGSSITTDAAAGIAELTWLGVRPRAGG